MSTEVIKEMENWKRGGKSEETELPKGEVEAASTEETTEVVAEAAVEETPPAKEETKAEEKLILIGDREFTSEAEAFKYAESLAQEKIKSEFYNQGVQEALRALKPQEETKAAEEDDLELYTDPKAAMAKVEQRATQRAIETIKAEQKKEQLWTTFEAQYPDIRREDADRILREPENWETIGRMEDHAKAMKILATKTRAYYQEIIDRVKPRTELPNKGGQAVSSGISTSMSVTPQKKEPVSTNFIAEMKKMRR